VLRFLPREPRPRTCKLGAQRAEGALKPLQQPAPSRTPNTLGKIAPNVSRARGAARVLLRPLPPCLDLLPALRGRRAKDRVDDAHVGDGTLHVVLDRLAGAD